MNSPTDTSPNGRCCQDEEVRVQVVQKILDKYQDRRGGLIAILEEIQARYGYLPETALRLVSERTGRSLVDVYGVATFYKSFSLEPRGRHLCSVCSGTACHVRGAPAVAEEFVKQLGVDPGHTTEDREFTLDTVACLGACALGPIVVIDGHYFSNVDPRSVGSVIESAKAGLDRTESESDERIFPVTVSCSRCNHSLMDPAQQIDGKPSIRVTVSFEGAHGPLWLSSLYGSYEIKAGAEIPDDTVLDVFCPHCHAELRSASLCPVCDAPMVSMIVSGGGIIQVCSRRGCRGHMLDLEGSAV
jgi:NADH-quinone oxidoreductase subunit E